MRDDQKLTGRSKRRTSSKKAADAVPASSTAVGSEGESAAPVEQPSPAAPTPRASRSRKQPVVESDREQVLAANAMFYRAFEVRDIDLMGQLWANAPHVRCIHPGWEPLYGWEEVIGSWTQIFKGMETLRFTLADVSVRVGGTMAWVELNEMLEATHEGKPARSQVLATNLFERGADGRWRLVHHHASPIMVRQSQPRRGGPSLH